MKFKNLKIFLVRWLPMMIMMGLIFLSSADYNPYRWLPDAWFDHSSSGGVTREDVGHLGHYVEFTLLGLTVLRAVAWDQDLTIRLIVFSTAFCVIYAFTDEFHQLFVPGRAFQVQDLLIDSGGVFTGMLLKYIYNRTLLPMIS